MLNILSNYKHCILTSELFISLLTLGTLTFLVIIYRVVDGDSESLHRIRENWKYAPITEIQSLEMDKSCPDGFQNIITNLKFPGLANGCNCQGVPPYDSARNDHLLGSDKFGSLCTFEEYISGCKNVFQTSSQKINNYKNRTLCVKRQDKTFYDYYENSLVNETKACNKKDCGIIDTKGNRLCLDECPINSILFGLTKEQLEHYGKDYKTLYLLDYVKNKFTNDYNISYTTQGNSTFSKVYTEFKISRVISGEACFQSLEDSQSLLFNDCKFVDVKEPISQTCKNKYNYEILDEIPEFHFYHNHRIDSIFSQITTCYYSYSSTIKNNNKALVAQSYFGFDLNNCDKTLTLRFMKIIKGRRNIRDNHLIALNILCYIIFFFFFLICICYKWKMLIYNDFRTKQAKIIWIELSLSFTFLIISIILIVKYALLKEEMDSLEHIKDGNCGDLHITQVAKQLYYYNLETTKNLFRGFFLIFFSCFIYPIKILIMRYMLRKKLAEGQTLVRVDGISEFQRIGDN
jgi:hypothetical protein